MNKGITKNQENQLNFFTVYQCCLAIFSTVIWFTNLDSYTYLKMDLLLPKYYFYGLTAACIPLLPNFLRDIKYLNRVKAFLFWCGSYLAIAAISLLSLPVIPELISDEFELRVLAIGVMLVSLVLLSRSNRVSFAVKVTILAITLFNVAHNFYNLLNPDIFASINPSGRPAGFYVDPNSSGFAIIAGTIFSIGILSPIYRFIFLLIVGSGVFITFSRGSIILFVVVSIIFLCGQTISRKQLIFWVLALITILAIASFLEFNFIQNYLWQLQQQGIMNENIISRLNWFSNESSYNAYSDNSRTEIIDYCLRVFSQKPFLGHGIGYTRVWDGEIRPHNMYLLFIVEHGILGILIMPILIWIVVKNARGETRNMAIAFAILMLLRCIFSHNVLEERYSLFCFSLMMVLTTQSLIKKENLLNNKK